MFRDRAGIVGSSSAITKLMQRAEKMALSDATVLLQGETGVGKELVARFIHKASGRTGEFVAISLAAIPESLIEAELFGIEKGAFTSATASRAGLLQRAQGGTVFLDEVGEVSARVQVKLLRVLQEKQITRVGGSEASKLDVRIIAATNRNLAEAVDQGIFRQDLYYRLKVLPIEVPALRERIEDLEELIKYFSLNNSFASTRPLKFSAAALAAMASYPWPGNIRELKALVDRLSFSNESGYVTLTDLPDAIKYLAPNSKIRSNEGLEGTASTLEKLLAEYEQGLIQRALDLHAGSVSAAAMYLGVKRTTLHDKLRRYGLRTQPLD